MGVGNELEIFITLKKYNTRQRREEDKALVVNYHVSILPPFIIVSNVFSGIGAYCS